MLLPGTININRPSGQSDEERLTGNMSELRAVAVPIYMNGNYKPCHVCQDDTVKETNYHMHQPIEYVVQLERSVTFCLRKYGRSKGISRSQMVDSYLEIRHFEKKNQTHESPKLKGKIKTPGEKSQNSKGKLKV